MIVPLLRNISEIVFSRYEFVKRWVSNVLLDAVATECLLSVMALRHVTYVYSL